MVVPVYRSKTVFSRPIRTVELNCSFNTRFAFMYSTSYSTHFTLGPYTACIDATEVGRTVPTVCLDGATS
jgi:hypothetical protein